MRIVLVGTGNLATRLGLVIQSKTGSIVQIYGRNPDATSRLASRIQVPFTLQKNEIAEADLYILAVSDDAISDVMEGFDFGEAIVVHAAGSIDSSVLAPYSANYGVIYPLQTLSVEKDVDFSEIPIFIEASNDRTKTVLKPLAEAISNHVYDITSAQRAALHLAAVFVCNFVNHCYAIGEQLVESSGLDYNILLPLIRETAEKALLHSPGTVQTGPAVRGNRTVIHKHLEMLAIYPVWQELYANLSSDIAAQKLKNNK